MVHRLNSLSISNVTVPKMQFKHHLLTGEESDRRLTAVVQRSGDITHQSTVRCYTRQGSAQVASDFEERPNTDASVITFLPGKVCSAVCVRRLTVTICSDVFISRRHEEVSTQYFTVLVVLEDLTVKPQTTTIFFIHHYLIKYTKHTKYINVFN